MLMQDRLVFHSARLLLRPLQEADRTAYLAMQRASEAYFARYAPPLPGEDDPDVRFTNMLRRSREGFSSGSAARLAAFLRSDPGEMVGQVNLADIIRSATLRANMGWRIAEAHTGRGLATEAVGALVRMALRSETEGGLGLHRVEAAIQPANAASLRVAAKVGFTQFGFARRLIRLAGTWTDHILFSIDTEDLAPPHPLVLPEGHSTHG
jgi:[ribosomal protein S5]-alanine N-acetyltransferase